jgi:hypothetical protein
LTRWLCLLFLAALTVGCGETNHSNGDSFVVEAEVTGILRGYSSRVLDGLSLNGQHRAGEVIHPSPCDTDSADSSPSMQSATHFWQVDAVPKNEVRPAIERLREYLETRGWEIVDHATPPDVRNPVVRARNPRDNYVIRVKGMVDINRVIARVSSPCRKSSKRSP